MAKFLQKSLPLPDFSIHNPKSQPFPMPNQKEDRKEKQKLGKINIFYSLIYYINFKKEENKELWKTKTLQLIFKLL